VQKSKEDDVKNSSLKLNIGKVTNNDNITPKKDNHDAEENINIKKD